MMLIAEKIDGFTIYHIWWVTPSKFLKMFQEAFSFGTLLRTEGLFSVRDHQLSFGVHRDALVEELQYYFEQTQAAEHLEEVYRYVGCRTDFADIQNKKECGGNRQWQNHYLRNWAANTKGKGII